MRTALEMVFLRAARLLQSRREIIPDPERFALLRAAWHRYATGAHTLTTIADWLLRYKGRLISGSHEPMITKQVFDRVHEILRQRGTPRPVLKDFTCRGFLVCGECGCMVTAEDKVKFYHGTNRPAVYVYYHCSRSKGRCRQPAIRQDVLEGQIAGQLETLAIPDQVLGLIQRALQDSHAQEKEFRDAAVTALRRRQDDIQKKQDVLLDRPLDGTITQEVYHEKYTALQNEKAEILVELEAQ